MTESKLIAAEDEASWWRRPAGGREVLLVAFPLVISSLSWTVMTFIDRVFLSWVPGPAMASAFSAGAVWFGVVCFPLGVCTYASTFVSQYHGAQQQERIGPAVWQGFWSAVLLSPLTLLAIYFAPVVFRLAEHGQAAYLLEVEYFQILCLGAPAMWISQAFSSFYSGRGKTSVVMWIDALCAVVNLVLDYLWIFGYAGFPEMGVAGAAWATTLALWLKAGVYFAFVMQKKYRQQFGIWSGMRLDPALLARLFYYGGPSGFQMLLDVMGFTTFILVLGRLGQIEADATTMVFSVSTLAFMPIWGVSLAVSILVGQRLGEDRDDLAARSTWTAYALGLIYMAMLSTLFVLVPDIFLFGFFAGENASESQLATYALAVVLLRFVAAYNCFDATFMIFVSAVKGAGDTMYVLGVSLVMASLLAAISWLSVEVFHLGILGCWSLITIWVWMLGLIFLRRFLQGKWRSMRVIEPLPPDLALLEEPTPEPAPATP